MRGSKVVVACIFNELQTVGLFLTFDGASTCTDPFTSGKNYHKLVNNAGFMHNKSLFFVSVVSAFQLKHMPRLLRSVCPGGYQIRTIDWYTHAHHVPHAEHVESSIRRNGEGRSTVEMMPCCASAYPVHGSASKVNHSGADAQVVPCHGYLVFHPYVKQLTSMSLDLFWRRVLSYESSTST